MNEYEKARRLAEDIRQIYPAGTRIVLLSMDDPQAVPVGTRGTVKNIDDMAHIDMEWDNGRTLSLVPLVDSFRKLTEQELAEERLNAAKALNADKEMFCIDASMGIFEGYHIGYVWNGWMTPSFTKNVAEQICKTFESENHHFSYDEERDCFIDICEIDGDKSEYEGKDYNINGELKHLYPIGSGEWTWSKATQEEIEDENNAICVEESTDELIEESEITQSM